MTKTITLFCFLLLLYGGDACRIPVGFSVEILLRL
jgi:hypothetical protein